jgi:tetratricopeptide (TPR) repeat protein
MKATIVVATTCLTLGLTSAVANAAPADACTAEQGQAFIDSGNYDKAIKEFTCVIDADPTGVDGYRGRIEAELLSRQFSNSVRDYARVTALVLPVHPDAQSLILEDYNDRLAATPNNIAALTGLSFADWWFFDYPAAIHVLNQLLAIAPNDVYGNLFRGSTRLLSNAGAAQGAADLERAIALAPSSPDVHFIVADAYTYGKPDRQRAFNEASLALAGGLNTPRVHAILAASYQAFGNVVAAATEIKIHLDLVTTDLVATDPLPANGSMALDLVPGRTYEIPLPVTAGRAVSVVTGSHDFLDTILVLLAPDGSPVLGSDDSKSYFAAFKWVPPSSGVYRIQVTSFESVSTGVLTVTRH